MTKKIREISFQNELHFSNLKFGCVERGLPCYFRSMISPLASYALIFGIFGLLGLELCFRRADYRLNDSLSNLLSGLTLISFEVYFRLVFVFIYSWLYHQFHFLNLSPTLLIQIIALVVLDFAQFINHWVSHRCNFFWAAHIGHHFSESFNLTVG
ncbi:MAG: hypothetical protein EOP09_09255, partial [Proteobacteria bacterium]